MRSAATVATWNAKLCLETPQPAACIGAPQPAAIEHATWQVEAQKYAERIAAESDKWRPECDSPAQEFFAELCDPYGRYAAVVEATAAALDAAPNNSMRQMAQLVAASHLMSGMKKDELEALPFWTCMYWCAISSSRGGQKGGMAGSALQAERSELCNRNRP